MGFEAIKIQMDSSVRTDELLAELTQKGFVSSDPSLDSINMKLEHVSPTFIVEAQLIDLGKKGATLKIEMALCNPDEADTFVAQVIEAMCKLGRTHIYFMTSLKPGLHFDTKYTCLSDLGATVREQAAGLRSNWQSAFGPKIGRVRVADAYRFAGVI